MVNLLFVFPFPNFSHQSRWFLTFPFFGFNQTNRLLVQHVGMVQFLAGQVCKHIAGDTWHGHVSVEVKTAYNKRKYETVTIRVKRDGSDGFTVEDVRKAAERDGMSVNAWLVELISDNL